MVVVEDLCKLFSVRGPTGRRAVLHAVDRVSLTIRRNEILRLGGGERVETPTLGRAILHLEKPTSGRVLFDGQDLTLLRGDAMRRLRRRMQIIFQNPHGSLTHELPLARPSVTHWIFRCRPPRLSEVSTGGGASPLGRPGSTIMLGAIPINFRADRPREWLPGREENGERPGVRRRSCLEQLRRGERKSDRANVLMR